jgi:hypothetical protein
MMPWTALLFLPVLAGLHAIFPWTHANHVVEPHKQWWFQPAFFIGRAALYIGAWSWLARRARRLLEDSDPQPSERQRFAGLGLVLYVLTVTFAAFDWLMSLDPHWASSLYGAMVLVGHTLTALAFAVALLSALARRIPEDFSVSNDTLHDLGNLLLAFVRLWAYMALSQYLIIWWANLPEEVGWYRARNRGGWEVVAALLLVLQFALPFFVLLSRRMKRSVARLGTVALGVLAIRGLDAYWLIMPSFSPGDFQWRWLHVAVPAALSSLWFAVFLRHLRAETRP